MSSTSANAFVDNIDNNNNEQEEDGNSSSSSLAAARDDGDDSGGRFDNLSTAPINCSVVNALDAAVEQFALSSSAVVVDTDLVWNELPPGWDDEIKSDPIAAIVATPAPPSPIAQTSASAAAGEKDEEAADTDDDDGEDEEGEEGESEEGESGNDIDSDMLQFVDTCDVDGQGVSQLQQYLPPTSHHGQVVQPIDANGPVSAYLPPSHMSVIVAPPGHPDNNHLQQVLQTGSSSCHFGNGSPQHLQQQQPQRHSTPSLDDVSLTGACGGASRSWWLHSPSASAAATVDSASPMWLGLFANNAAYNSACGSSGYGTNASSHPSFQLNASSPPSSSWAAGDPSHQFQSQQQQQSVLMISPPPIQPGAFNTGTKGCRSNNSCYDPILPQMTNDNIMFSRHLGYQQQQQQAAGFIDWCSNVASAGGGGHSITGRAAGAGSPEYSLGGSGGGFTSLAPVKSETLNGRYHQSSSSPSAFDQRHFNNVSLLIVFLCSTLFVEKNALR